MPNDSTPNFQLLFESAPDLYMVLSPALHIVAASDTYLRATLVERAKTIGRPLFEVFPDNPDDPAADGMRNLRLSLEYVLLHGRANTMAVQKYDVRDANGIFEERYWSCVNSPVFDTQGQVCAIIHRAEDVTEYVRLKQDQEVLQSRAAHMEQEVYRRAQEVQRANQEIADKNAELELASRTKSEFLANMSHELRTPLNAVIGFSDVLKAGLGGTLNAKQLEYVGHIHQSGQHLLALINDILDLSKVEAGKMELDLAELNVPALLAASMNVIRAKASLRKIRLDFDVAPEINTIEADERKLKQILYNLLSNAVKFSKDATQVSVGVRRVSSAQVGRLETTQPHRVLLVPSPDFQTFVEITVNDEGIGISQAALDRLFEPFTQADSSLSRKFEGTGLGLVMVVRLVELLGGSVGVVSEEGKGTRFTVWLPLRTPQIEPAANDSVRTALSVQGKHVLVIEDDDKAAEIIEMQLQHEGLKVERVATAEAGLAVAREKHFDLIALDILLPGMDGWTFLAKIKEFPETADLPVVIVSVLAERNQGVALGASAILQKPISQQMLGDVLKRLRFKRAQDNKPRVLLVDDDPRSVELAANYLREADCIVLAANGGEAGVASALLEQPDLIVLDLMMPGMSGFEVVDALKKDGRTDHIPILVLTAKQIETADRDRLSGSVMQIMEKSEFNHGRFIREVRRVLG